MKLIENSISDTLYKRCCKELNGLNNATGWSSSRLIWSNELKDGIIGSCLCTPVSDELHHLLEEELKSTLPECDILRFQHYIWQVGSGICWHNDWSPTRVFGATIYLNEKTDINSGGWFIWEDKDGGHHVYRPEKKALIINDEYECHCVTPVALEFRCSIQIWGERSRPFIPHGTHDH